MLSPTSAAQKNVTEEDSSGSDVGSEVSLEPETDRFGFIVTNGSTAGNVGPSPELVRQREAKWISIILHEDRILSMKKNKIKEQCQKGIPASLRAKAWPLLCGASIKMKQNEKLYERLDLQPGLQSWVDIIERDLDRQFPFHEMFLSKDGHGQRGLFRVLKAFTQYQPEEGYCQAQGPVAAVLLMNMPAEEAFWCLVQISQQYLPGYYSPLLEGVLFDAALLTWVLKKTCPAAHKHLQHHGVEPLMFATDWLMCLFTRHLPFNTLLRVWDLFFCYGVRVLLQVAVVLVRRVLGRADQRKQCPGQMETLERLRSIKEQVQDEDDEAFIAEVCSVPLSSKELEKQREKEFDKWKKDRPSSTFDPRGHCRGYQMACTRAQQEKEEQDRKDREKGNLSVPLARSSSTLSLSPSLLHKKWRKGGKGSTGEKEGGNRVVRHLSMGAREDMRGWTDLDFKKVQGVQEEEDIVLEVHKTQSESGPKESPDQKELLQEHKDTEQSQNIQTEHKDETEIEKVETRTAEKEENALKEAEDSETLPDQKDEISQSSAKDEAVENVVQPTEHTPHCEEEDELQAESQSLDDKCEDQEIKVEDTNEDTNEDTEECVTENTTAAEDDQTQTQSEGETKADAERRASVDSSEEQVTPTDAKPEESTETENVQQEQTDTVTEDSETRTETSLDPEGGDDEASTVKDQAPAAETETQQEEEDEEEEDEGGTFEGKCRSTESLVETENTEESHTQAVTETEELAQTQENEEENADAPDETTVDSMQTDSEEATSMMTSPECIEQQDGAETQTQTDAETPVPVREPNDEACEPTQEPAQENEERDLTLQPEAEADACICDETNAEEAATENQMIEEAAKESEEALVEEPDTEPDEKSPEQTDTSEPQTTEQPTSQVTESPPEEESTENVEEHTAREDDVFTSTVPTDDPLNDSKPQVQDKDSVRSQSESLAQPSGRRSSRSSADFCVRRSSTSRGSRLARKLSEDLFTYPQATSQSQRAPNHPNAEDAESPSSPAAANSEQADPDATRPAEVAEEVSAQQEQQPQKRFGLFRRKKGEQPKNSKAKGAPKLQVPKILIQDFSDGPGAGMVVEEKAEEKLSSRERRRRRREQERREKEEERLKKKKEKEEKEKERERRKPQTRGKSFQEQKGSDEVPPPAKTGSQTFRYSAPYTDSYF
ncbi:ecotropic viral integration site 5 ortholog [Mugil cephalus]|uniref:ecotropic viral integration site 5 ortholog n=1 Tax=Mugil cephalus TaxID=48193 RepID=UPI001FB6A089|nr:ecotropic viral integration site 5 ortholog [Mugil cephalus]XP_047440939.1 ecotropic viral integration site 5 ortholog [Mugil cephalus]